MRAVHRFLVPGIPPVGDTVTLPADEAAHASRVLRLGAGCVVGLFDGRGGACSGVIASTNKSGTEVTVRIDGPREAAREPRIAITVVHAVLKGDKMDDVVRDAVMMGAAAIQPIVTARSETSLAAITRGQRVDRWHRIAVASAKQCGRAVVSEILDARPLDADATWLTGPRIPDPRLLLVEPGTSQPARTPGEVGEPPAAAASIIVGPEGGWTPEELETLAPVTVPVTLGHRTLRADRAATIAMAALQAVWNDQ
jgi:16S rRNA (uracil1498-N3)-methyltransferase